ncbi:hypothetical protein Tco_0512290 [Tanacetum coccineum]
MGDANPIRTLGDYSKPSLHEGYRNTIELPEGNNVVPLRSDTIRLVQNGCAFHRLESEDPIQHVKDFLRIVDSIDLNGDTRNTTHLRLFHFSLHDKLSIGLIVYLRDPSQLGMISPLVSSHSFSHKEEWLNFEMISLCSNNVKINLFTTRRLVFSTWMAFGGNTHDLGSFGEETDEIMDLHQIHEEILFLERGDGIAGLK